MARLYSRMANEEKKEVRQRGPAALANSPRAAMCGHARPSSGHTYRHQNHKQNKAKYRWDVSTPHLERRWRSITQKKNIASLRCDDRVFIAACRQLGRGQKSKGEEKRVKFLSSRLHASNKPILPRSYTEDPFSCICGDISSFFFTPFKRSVSEWVSKGLPVPLLETKEGRVGFELRVVKSRNRTFRRAFLRFVHYSNGRRGYQP